MNVQAQDLTMKRLLCCCKLPASHKLLELEAELDAAVRAEPQPSPRRRSNSETDLLSKPLLEPLKKIREYEQRHGLPKTHYWSLDSEDATVDGLSKEDFDAVMI